MLVPRSLSVTLVLALTLVGVATAAPHPQPGPDTITVTGQVRYVDRDGITRPAAGVRVRIRDYDYDLPGRGEGPNEVLAEVQTDASGFFTAGDIDNRDFDGSPPRYDGTGQDVLVELLTDSDEIRLLNTRTFDPFIWSSITLLGRDAGIHRNVTSGSTENFDLLIQAGDPNVRGMNVYQILRRGWEFLPTKPALGAPIVAQWGVGSSEGDYYAPDDRIYLTDAAELYPHVILHHLAHALGWTLFGNNGYPVSCFGLGPHRMELPTTYDPVCAWAEGWAIGFAMAVLGDPGYRTALLHLDLEVPDATTPGWASGDTVPGRVAGAVWDLFDTTRDGYDIFPAAGDAAERFAPLWESYQRGAPTTTAAFWQAWLDGGYDACDGVRSLFQNTIDYNHAPDVSPLPDITVEEDTVREHEVDLWLFAQDAECPDERLTFSIANEIPPEFGLSIADNRYINVAPAPDWFGSVEVEIHVSDGLETTKRFFTLTVGGVNDAPTLQDVPRFEALVNTPIQVDLEPYVDDVDNLKSELGAFVEGLQHATVEGEGSLNLTFTPAQDFEGVETAQVHVEDPAGASSRTVNLVLIWSRAPNHRPTVVGLEGRVFQQDAGLAIEIDFTPYGQDEEDRPEDLRWEVASWGEHISVSRRSDTVLEFRPVPTSFIGSDSVSVVVQDRDGGQSDPVVFFLRWTLPMNQPPMILRFLGEQKAFIGQPLVLDLAGYATDVDDPDSSLIWFPREDTVECCTFSLVREKQRIIFYPLSGWGTQSDEVELVVQDPKGGEASTSVLLTWELFKTYLPLLGRNAAGP